MNRTQALRLRLLRLSGRVRAPRRLPDTPRSVLVIRPDNIGDMVLTAPAVTALREAFPDARLTGWVGPWSEEVWRYLPALDGLEVLAFPGFSRARKPQPVEPYQLAVAAARDLAGRFDLAVNLRADFWWGAMAASWARIPVAGYDVAECRPFLSLTVPFDSSLHETDRALRLAYSVANRWQRAVSDAPPGLRWPDVGLAADVPAGALAIHAGAGAPVKLWTEDRWVAVADSLSNQAPVILTAGSPEEHAAAERIRRKMVHPAHTVHGLSLAELAALYRRCRVVIGPDNGPLHVARSVGTPTVALFGPTDPAQFGPRAQDGPAHEVVRLPWQCIPCRRLNYTAAELTYHLCVPLIEPEMVLAAARRVLSAQSAGALQGGRQAAGSR